MDDGQSSRPGIWRRLWTGWLYLWVLPNSVVGLLALMVCRLGGAEARVHSGVLEVCGPGIERLLGVMPVRFKIAAITLGHVVLGRDAVCLERTRAHERVHVEQFQRWGPLFLPLYVLASGIAWIKGGDFYRDNVFEREAYARDSASE